MTSIIAVLLHFLTVSLHH